MSYSRNCKMPPYKVINFEGEEEDITESTKSWSESDEFKNQKVVDKEILNQVFEEAHD